jgi:ferredoxin-NADP reductase
MAAPDDTLPDGIVSSHLVAMKAGEHVWCTAPHGALMRPQEQVSNERSTVLLSQGLGIAPMLSLLYELEARQARAAWLFHEAVAPEPQGLLREVCTLLERNPGFQMINAASGMPGHIDAALICRHVLLAQADVHVVGSRSFVERLVGELTLAGLDPSALLVQSFG